MAQAQVQNLNNNSTPTSSPEDYTLETIFNAIQILYSENPGITPTQKHGASSYLEGFQKSVHAWSFSDQILYLGQDISTRYFGAQTLRTKIQSCFYELPQEAHHPLRESLLQHISNITVATEHSVVNQLCLAVAQMILQDTSWADPIAHILHKFGSEPKHWWPLLEILSFIPEEIHSRKLHLGDNRRKEIISKLEGVARIVLAFMKQVLSQCVNHSLNSDEVPLEHICTGVLNCYKSWIHLNPEAFCNDRPNDILQFAVNELRNGKCSMRMHCVAMDSVIGMAEVLPELVATSKANNNSSTVLNSLQEELFNAILSFEEPYHNSVAEENSDKTQNYTRIFCDYAESMIDSMLKSWRAPHYSLRSLDLVLICTGHHEYEISEMTFGFWWRLSEELYETHDESLNKLFQPYVTRLIHSVYNHCRMDEDQEGPLTANDEFYEFRNKVSDLIEDVIFVVGSEAVFLSLGQELIKPNQPWYSQEAALFLLHTVAKSLGKKKVKISEVVQPVLSTVINWTEWNHIMLRISAVRFIGGMSEWFGKNAMDHLIKALQFLANSLEFPDVSSYAGAAILQMCQHCADQLEPSHLDGLLQLLERMDHFNVDNDAIIGLLRGVGHVIVTLPLPSDMSSSTVRKICYAQLAPLNQLVETGQQNGSERNTKADPAYWLDRLSALFRSTSVNLIEGQQHPCAVALCQDSWPVLSKVCDKYQADSRIMERVCRCLRYAVRCVGKHSFQILTPLVTQLVGMYAQHRHSCFLYVGSILVDEYGAEGTCVAGLLNMLEAFYAPTLQLLVEPNGFRNNPDTVDDFYRLCSRYLQRCPVQFLKSEIAQQIMQLAVSGIHLDHREANGSVAKFLYEFVHQARREVRDSGCSPDQSLIGSLVKNILSSNGQIIVSSCISAVIFSLPTPLYIGICDIFYEMKEFVPNEFSEWLVNALKAQPNYSTTGIQYATFDQLGNFHKQVLSASSSKTMSRYVKDYCRLYR